MSQQEENTENTIPTINLEELIVEETPEQRAINLAYAQAYQELGIFNKYLPETEV